MHLSSVCTLSLALLLSALTTRRNWSIKKKNFWTKFTTELTKNQGNCQFDQKTMKCKWRYINGDLLARGCNRRVWSNFKHYKSNLANSSDHSLISTLYPYLLTNAFRQPSTAFDSSFLWILGRQSFFSRQPFKEVACQLQPVNLAVDTLQR